MQGTGEGGLKRRVLGGGADQEKKETGPVLGWRTGVRMIGFYWGGSGGEGGTSHFLKVLGNEKKKEKKKKKKRKKKNKKKIGKEKKRKRKKNESLLHWGRGGNEYSLEKEKGADDGRYTEYMNTYCFFEILVGGRGFRGRGRERTTADGRLHHDKKKSHKSPRPA